MGDVMMTLQSLVGDGSIACRGESWFPVLPPTKKAKTKRAQAKAETVSGDVFIRYTFYPLDDSAEEDAEAITRGMLTIDVVSAEELPVMAGAKYRLSSSGLIFNRIIISKLLTLNSQPIIIGAAANPFATVARYDCERSRSPHIRTTLAPIFNFRTSFDIDTTPFATATVALHHHDKLRSPKIGEAVLQLRDIIGDGSEAFETQSWFPLTLSAWEAEQASHEIQGRVLLRIDYVPIQGTLGSAGFVISGALKKKKNLEGSNIFQKRVYSFSGNEVAYSASMSDIGSSKKMHTPSFQLSALRSVEIPSLHPHLKDLGAGFDLVFLDRAFQFTHDGCVHVCVCVHMGECARTCLFSRASVISHSPHTLPFCIFSYS